jgi:enoyl-CoA hydratase
MSGADDILFDVEDGLALATLNRPQALNAFTLDMYRRLDPVLRQWEADRAIAVVAIRGAGDRAFCAGGDIRAIYEAGRGIGPDPSLTAAFFREEYRLIRRIHRYSKPYIAIIDGITMGGGAGMSLNGAYRVATERTALAMPETGIGLFPDVGATQFLNRCPGRIGLYMGLSGARLGGADALYCGLATHFMPRGRTEDLLAALSASDGAVEAVLAKFASDPGSSPIAARQAAIDRVFADDTVEAIIAALEQETGVDAEWAAETRTNLLLKSPTSQKIFLRQMTIGRGFNLEAALVLEYRISQHVMAGHDFYEGVRAAIIDRGQRPRWRPPTLAAVDAATVDGYFAPLRAEELTFE